MRWLGAVHAQDYSGAAWALALRTAAPDVQAIDKAFNEGKILRTHVMRPTWHLVAPGDVRWLLRLTRPRVHAANGYSYRKFELQAGLLRKSAALIERALADGQQLTRTQLAGSLRQGGIEASGLRLAYILMHAELEEITCSGALRGRQFTYALFRGTCPAGRHPRSR